MPVHQMVVLRGGGVDPEVGVCVGVANLVVVSRVRARVVGIKYCPAVQALPRALNGFPRLRIALAPSLFLSQQDYWSMPHQCHQEKLDSILNSY